MTVKTLFDHLQKEFKDLLITHHLSDETINVSTKSLTPEEAIGVTKRKDFPILTGSEVMVQAKYKGSYGQAFTDAPILFQGTLEEISNLNIHENAYNRSIFIATLNALKSELKQTDNVIHCRNDGPELCAKHILSHLEKEYVPHQTKILLVGYQPSMIGQISDNFPLRVLDLNPKNIGAVKDGVTIEHGINDMKEAIEWADLILCTGSTLSNGSIVDYINLDKEVLFFGTTISGSADLLNAKRICFADVVAQ